MTDIRLPDISGTTEAEQLRQVRSYLYQLAEQLQFALGQVQEQPRAAAPAAEPSQPNVGFAAIKSMIIKSADIVDAYCEEITRRLEGHYVAQSDFGTYSQQTAQDIEENAEGIRRSFENLQSITDSVAVITRQLLDVSAYIKTGLLCYDDSGIPVYGVEIGQEERREDVLSFRRYARLTAGKLSFFDSSGSEVAYISDRALHITQAQIVRLDADIATAGSLRLGSYTWTPGADGHLTLS